MSSVAPLDNDNYQTTSSEGSDSRGGDSWGSDSWGSDSRGSRPPTIGAVDSPPVMTSQDYFAASRSFRSDPTKLCMKIKSNAGKFIADEIKESSVKHKIIDKSKVVEVSLLNYTEP